MILMLGMIVQGATLALVTACAQHIGVATMSGLIEHESGWQRYAIGDNTSRRAYFPQDYETANRTVRELVAEGHSLDVGLAQVNTENWAHYGLTPENVFDPCLNVAVGADILERSYQGAVEHGFRPGDDALQHALSAYNSGRYYASLGYANTVIGLARNVREGYIAVPNPAPSFMPNVSAAPRPAKALPAKTPPIGHAAAWAIQHQPSPLSVANWGVPSR